jgi:peptidoglycan lytic transglycosylase F
MDEHGHNVGTTMLERLSFAMRVQILVFAVLILCGCSSKDSPKETEQALPSHERSQNIEQEVSASQPEPYIETGDLDVLRQRGIVRLLAPRFDNVQELPRAGMAVQEYQELAERFVISLGLSVEWVFVDRFDDLLNKLNTGHGDLVITNLSVTRQRQANAVFSVTLARVDEVLITHKDSPIDSLDGLGGLTIAVPEGTAYLETLERLKKQHPTLTVQVDAGSMSDSEMLQRVESKTVSATVVDSDVADLLLSQYPMLSKGPLLKKHRKIAWAARKANLQLTRALNEFLVAEHIQSGHSQTAHRDWEQIKTAKKLRILTLNNPSSYFMWRGELMGFDYALMKDFSKRNQLRLEVIVKDDIDALIEALNNGDGDLIASSLTVTDDRRQRGVSFSRRYMHVREQLVGHSGGEKIELIEQLQGKRVAVNPQTVFYQRLKTLKDNGIDFNMVLKPGVATETLIAGLSSGEYDFTVADSHLAAIEKSYRDDIVINLDLTAEVDIAWGVRADQPMLLDKLNAYIAKEYRGLFYNVTFKKYFVNSKNILRHKKYRVIADGVLSPFDQNVKTQSKNYSLDWRLITSQIYQESKFNPKAKSFAGAQGLMQVMPRTAKEFGYDDLYEPDRGIAAGLAYMDWLHDRFPGSMALDERLYFVLAAYNAGAGHVRDARALAKQLGKDPNRWFDNVEEAMLLLSKPAYAKKARFGYVRGSEPVNYVRNIRDRYLGYLKVAEIDQKKL